MRGILTSPFTSREIRPFAARSSADDLSTLTGYTEAGRVTPVIDRTYPLSSTAEALCYYSEGHVRGKVIITVGEGGSTDARGS